MSQCLYISTSFVINTIIHVIAGSHDCSAEESRDHCSGYATACTFVLYTTGVDFQCTCADGYTGSKCEYGMALLRIGIFMSILLIKHLVI